MGTRNDRRGWISTTQRERVCVCVSWLASTMGSHGNTSIRSINTTPWTFKKRNTNPQVLRNDNHSIPSRHTRTVQWSRESGKRELAHLDCSLGLGI